MTRVGPIGKDELDRLLANVVMNMPKFRPTSWFQAGMDQFTIVARDASWRTDFVRNASIELLFHPHKKVVIGLHITNAASLVKQNAETLMPIAGKVSALKLLRLSKKRDADAVGELTAEAKSAYRKAEALLKKHKIIFREEDILKALLAKTV